MTDDKRFTVTQIADRLEEPPQRVAYVIAKHRIKPMDRIGIIRLFSEGQIEAVKQGLYELQIRSSSR